jgi:hypothetical protein
MVRAMRYAWMLVLASCAATGESVGSGLIGGIEDGRRGGAHLRDREAYEQFRAKHHRVEGRGKRDAHSAPLPDFDFTKQDLVIVWSGTMYRPVEIVSIGQDAVEAREERPEFNESAAARMHAVGCYRMIAIPKADKTLEIRWAE